MSRNKEKAENNKLIHGLVVISESFKEMHITSDDVIETFDVIDFVHYFEEIKDFRNHERITYKLQNLLLMVFIVILSRGICSFHGIASYIRIEKKLFSRYGLIENDKCPSHDTFRRVFELLDGKTLFEQTIKRLYEFLQMLESEIIGHGTYKQLMIDGKEVCGSGRSSNSKNPKRNIQILNVFDSSLQTCIYSEYIDEKTNEIPVAQKYLSGMHLKNVVVTADALHCQKTTATLIAKNKGIYVLTVKDNQASLLEEIRSRIDNNPDKVVSIIRGKREFSFYELPKGYAVDGFTNMKMFVRMGSHTHSKRTKETRCFIANTTDKILICEAIENRWDIENGLHKEKDTVLHEDLFRSTYKNTVLNMAIMNNLVLQMIKIYQSISEMNAHDSKLYMQCHPIECLQTITSLINNNKVIEKVKSGMRSIKKLRLA